MMIVLLWTLGCVEYSLQDPLANVDAPMDTAQPIVDEPEAAMGVYREMSERFPDDTQIHDEMAQLHARAEDWEQLSAVLGAKLRILVDDANTTGSELAELQCKLGMLAYVQTSALSLLLLD